MSDRGALVAAVILGRPLCLPCIAAKATESLETTATALERIETVVVVLRASERCQSCGLETEVLWIDRPESERR